MLNHAKPLKKGWNLKRVNEHQRVNLHRKSWQPSHLGDSNSDKLCFYLSGGVTINPITQVFLPEPLSAPHLVVRPA